MRNGEEIWVVYLGLNFAIRKWYGWIGLGWLGSGLYMINCTLEVYLDDVLVSKAPIYMLVIVELPYGMRF